MGKKLKMNSWFPVRRIKQNFLKTLKNGTENIYDTFLRHVLSKCSSCILCFILPSQLLISLLTLPSHLLARTLTRGGFAGHSCFKAFIYIGNSVKASEVWTYHRIPCIDSYDPPRDLLHPSSFVLPWLISRSTSYLHGPMHEYNDAPRFFDAIFCKP